VLADFLIIFAGIAVILLLGEVVIRNAMELARIFHLSGTFIGLTVLSIGTSIPELLAHVVGSVTILRQPANMDAISGLLIGTNIGSDIFQQNLVLPLVGLVGTVLVVRKNLVAEVGALVGAAVLVWVFCLGGNVSRVEGAILVVAYAAYLVFLARDNHLVEHVAKNGTRSKRRIALASTLIILCFAIMAVVTERVVLAATGLVDLLPISASFFGVIVLGVAAALPELTTSLISIAKGDKGISAGILIGSNVTNPLLGIGLGAIISRYTVPDVIVLYDLPVKILTAALLFVFLWRHEDLNKKEAITLIGLFFVYLYARQVWFPLDAVTL
jgi:cation:H+ antiporter